MSEYMVMTSSCNSPASKRWPGYRNIALVRTDGRIPKMISMRARGMEEIIEYEYSVYVGSRGRGFKLVESLTAKADRLNGTQAFRDFFRD
jgi:hypothetical protein